MLARKEFLSELIHVARVLFLGFAGCASMVSLAQSPDLAAKQKHIEAKSKAAYEQIRPTIEKIKVGESRAGVLAMMKWSETDVAAFEVRERGQRSFLFYHFYPGVLTPFNIRSYVRPENLREIHFGYLEGMMLRPRKIAIFERDVVAKLVDIPDASDEFQKLAGTPGAAVKPSALGMHLSREAYELFLTKKDRIVPGMHIWEVYTLLETNYLMSSDLQSFTTMCPGLLNAKRPPESTETADGIRTVYPFGYMEGDIEYPQWEVIAINRNVVEVRPYRSGKQNN